MKSIYVLSLIRYGLTLVAPSPASASGSPDGKRNLRQNRMLGGILQEKGATRHRKLSSLTGFFSEEDDAVSCSQFSDFHVVTAIYCEGAYCDNMQLECEQPLVDIQNGDYQVYDRHWTDWISDEDSGRGIILCPNTHFITGLECDGSYCDNIGFECTSFFSKPGNTNRPTGQGLVPDEENCRTYTDFSDEDYRQDFSLPDDNPAYLVGIGCKESVCGNQLFGICLSRNGAYCDNKDLRVCGTTHIANPPAGNGKACRGSDECQSGCCTKNRPTVQGHTACRPSFLVQDNCF